MCLNGENDLIKSGSIPFALNSDMESIAVNSDTASHSSTQMMKVEPIDSYTLSDVNRTPTPDLASKAEEYIKQESVDLESLSGSATDSADNSEIKPTQPAKKVRFSSVPHVPKPSKRTIQTRYPGDFSVNDFQSEENKRIYQELITKRQSVQKAVNVLQRKRRYLDAKILKLRTTIKIIRDNCGDLPVDAKKLEEICESDGSYDSDCADSSDVETTKANVDIFNTAEFMLPKRGEDRHRIVSESENIDDFTNEDQLLSFCNFTFANQVQLTFSSHNEDREFRKLRKKITWAAERDIALSREIYQLKNSVFLQNKKIEEMKRNLTKIKGEKN
ncbi:uncharacterized protein [Euwallacea similis]|uniref:uncharacterized protein n=1 Tax=Euwallacea similis TaxID=1736056 RepID=UPI003450F0A0